VTDLQRICGLSSTEGSTVSLCAALVSVLLLQVDLLPLWLFHALMTRCTCSMPAPATPFDRQWNPCHSLFTLPLILSFELLLCCHLAAMEGTA